jgi:hypothetical protein
MQSSILECVLRVYYNNDGVWLLLKIHEDKLIRPFLFGIRRTAVEFRRI